MGIVENLAKILSSRYGRDVRQAIHDSIEEGYNIATDAKTAAITAQDSASNSAIAANNSKVAAAGSAAEAKHYAESIGGALRPMGTITFSQLPAVATATAGDCYNISDAFTTTSDFEEGAGIKVAAGANVYKTVGGKWDVLAGAFVTGVKGSAEANYRTGDVEITKANIGLGNVRNEDVGDTDISGIGATIKAAIKALADKIGSVALPTTAQSLTGAIAELDTNITTKQNKTDNSLTTTSKTVVGAINEINSDLAITKTAIISGYTQANNLLLIDRKICHGHAEFTISAAVIAAQTNPYLVVGYLNSAYHIDGQELSAIIGGEGNNIYPTVQFIYWDDVNNRTNISVFLSPEIKNANDHIKFYIDFDILLE